MKLYSANETAEIFDASDLDEPPADIDIPVDLNIPEETTFEEILDKNNNAQIVCIAPWYSMDYDPYCGVSLKQKPQLYQDYLSALKTFCEKNGFLYIDANPEIFKEMPLSHKVVGGYLRDQIHPTSLSGIRLFSKSCLKASM